MDYNITLIERLVLESLFNHPKSIQDLEDCTGLKKVVLNNIINLLVTRNIVCIQNQLYTLNKNLNQAILKELNDETSISIEVHEIIAACLRLHKNKKNFKLKKVLLDQKEEKILQGLLFNLESFLNELPNKKNIRTKNQKIIFWGGENYENIINNTLSY